MDNLSDAQQKRMAEVGQAVLNMSHGIKNIAQSMRCSAEVMDKTLDVGDLDVAKRTWDVIKQNLERIEKLSLDMLTFSKDQVLNLQPCDFNKIIESAIQTVRPQADQQQVEILTELTEQIPRISVDAERMADVVINLLINAVVAVSDETGQVVISTEFDSNAQDIILQISDNGPGIENPDRIFEPFYTTKSNAGIGLGLTIARTIVEKHAGIIEVQSSPGKGAAFTVRIPSAWT